MSHLSMRQLVDHVDVVLLVFDSLRYDVATAALREGRTPVLASHLPEGGWERRLTPACFTYPAHHAFFAGYLPVADVPEPAPRHFACRFPGSETVGPNTLELDAASVPEGLARRGYRTVSVGGVGFFNPGHPLGTVLPGLFQEHHWSPATGVTAVDSPRVQVELACRLLEETPPPQRVFLFINLPATHQPTVEYLPASLRAGGESPASQAAALAAVDRCLPPLFAALRRRGAAVIACADHGTCFGEEGYHGHRRPHPLVWTVPYAEFLLTEAAV